jgi:hypothetical protein
MHIAGVSTQQLESNVALARTLLRYDERAAAAPSIVDSCAPSFLLGEAESQLVVEKYVLLGAASLCDASRCQLYSLPDLGDGGGALVAIRRLPYRSPEHRRDLVARIALLERASPHRSLLTPVTLLCFIHRSLSLTLYHSLHWLILRNAMNCGWLPNIWPAHVSVYLLAWRHYPTMLLLMLRSNWLVDWYCFVFFFFVIRIALSSPLTTHCFHQRLIYIHWVLFIEEFVQHRLLFVTMEGLSNCNYYFFQVP